MEKINKKLCKKLELLSRDELYDILIRAGINFPNTERDDLTKEELLLVADEADQDILKVLLP